MPQTTADWVIGADGSASVIRRTTGSTESDDVRRRDRGRLPQLVELGREARLRAFEAMPVDAHCDRGVGVAHELWDLEWVGSLFDQQACVRVTQVERGSTQSPLCLA